MLGIFPWEKHAQYLWLIAFLFGWLVFVLIKTWTKGEGGGGKEEEMYSYRSHESYELSFSQNTAIPNKEKILNLTNFDLWFEGDSKHFWMDSCLKVRGLENAVALWNLFYQKILDNGQKKQIYSKDRPFLENKCQTHKPQPWNQWTTLKLQKRCHQGNVCPVCQVKVSKDNVKGSKQQRRWSRIYLGSLKQGCDVSAMKTM